MDGGNKRAMDEWMDGMIEQWMDEMIEQRTDGTIDGWMMDSTIER